jgi:hypothetical protein
VQAFDRISSCVIHTPFRRLGKKPAYHYLYCREAVLLKGAFPVKQPDQVVTAKIRGVGARIRVGKQ